MDMEKLYGGIDTHKENFVGYIMDEEGRLVREHSFPATKEAVEKFTTGIPNSQMTIAIEACGIWRGAYNIFRELGYEVKLASPKKVHDIVGSKKMDKEDAKALANLLRTNYVPEVYILDDDVLRLRDLARHKANLTRLRVKVQVKIKGYLLREGVKYGKNIWTKKALSELSEKDLNVKNRITVYWCLKGEEKEVMNRIRKMAKNMKKATLLMTMSGTGEYSAILILGEIGDIKRFKTPKELVSYAGLCPGIYQSGNTERTERNQAVNKWLKWILYECSGRASMLDPRFQSYYYKVQKKKGFKTARRAVGRKMLTIIWYMLTKEEPYRMAL